MASKRNACKIKKNTNIVALAKNRKLICDLVCDLTACCCTLKEFDRLSAE